ncbi:MAG: ribonuclease PH, partial [Psychrobacter sp.]|nr:ribonuclease PH [Psychrobacter sp.]
GGTCTASVTGAAIALIDALESLQKTKKLKADPLIGLVAAVSVGMKDGEAYLDLNYEEDASCDTDLNVVMTQKGEFIELQGTAEEKPFTRAQADDMLILAEKGIAELIAMQKTALGW